eukprot:GSChrysophyteH2.ASY1.ANO1.1302.1 assembled CDS
MNISPEPSTDKFNILIHGEDELVVAGAVAVGLPHLPFNGLSSFGIDFVNKMVATTVRSPILSKINIIDSPGILSGMKQKIERGYDFCTVIRWFAHRSDLILLMFDCSKTDISDELMAVIHELKDYSGRVRCILNKIDTVNPRELVRVYGSLMWSIGRIIKDAEVTRVYLSQQIDSTPSQTSQKDAEMKIMGLHDDQKALSSLIVNIHKGSLSRKVGNFIKRLRMLRAHILIMQYLRKRSPWIFELHYQKEARLSHDALSAMFAYLTTKYDITLHDFPPIDLLAKSLWCKQWQQIPTAKKYLHQVQSIILHDIRDISKNLFSALDVTYTAPPKPTRKPLAQLQTQSISDNEDEHSHFDDNDDICGNSVESDDIQREEKVIDEYARA